MLTTFESLVILESKQRLTSSLVVSRINDVGQLWETITANARAFEPLFTECTVPLTSKVLKDLMIIEWSEPGNNRRAKEDATVYCWELFLQQVEGNGMCTSC